MALMSGAILSLKLGEQLETQATVTLWIGLASAMPLMLLGYLMMETTHCLDDLDVPFKTSQKTTLFVALVSLWFSIGMIMTAMADARNSVWFTVLLNVGQCFMSIGALTFIHVMVLVANN